MKKVRGPIIAASWRDLAREGPGGCYAGGSPWAKKGIFIQGVDMRPTKESGPGLSPERRKKFENPNQKTVHEFVDAAGTCLYCVMVREGHDRLMERLSHGS